MAQTAEHMNAKVSPFIAFLTQMHQKISAMEPPVVNQIEGWQRIPEGQSLYLDASGKPMAASDFDKKTRQLVDDYKLDPVRHHHGTQLPEEPRLHGSAEAVTGGGSLWQRVGAAWGGPMAAPRFCNGIGTSVRQSLYRRYSGGRTI